MRNDWWWNSGIQCYFRLHSSYHEWLTFCFSDCLLCLDSGMMCWYVFSVLRQSLHHFGPDLYQHLSDEFWTTFMVQRGWILKTLVLLWQLNISFTDLHKGSSCTTMRLNFSWVFSCYDTLYFYSTTVQREIQHSLLYYIYLTATVTSYFTHAFYIQTTHDLIKCGTLL